MPNRFLIVIVASAGFFGGIASGGKSAPVAAQETPVVRERLDRTTLPIAEPKHAPITELDARNVKVPPHFEVKAPAGAPNVLIVLIDDMGFGQSSAFGGPIRQFARGAEARCLCAGSPVVGLGLQPFLRLVFIVSLPSQPPHEQREADNDGECNKGLVCFDLVCFEHGPLRPEHATPEHVPLFV